MHAISYHGTMKSIDTLPELVRAFVDGQSDGAALLAEFMRHVAKICDPYPAAYFVLNDKSNDGVDDLGHRSFTVCANVVKGRFPFMARVPFRAFVAEDFDGRTVRYHSFYAKISITRELLRDDYAKNIRRDPVLRWRAELYSSIGEALKEIAEPVVQGRGVPPRWQLKAPGLRMMQPLEVVEARLRQQLDKTTPALVQAALTFGGGLTQSRLTHLLEAVIGAPAKMEIDDPVVDANVSERMDIRGAVSAAWDDLEGLDRVLIIALARGDSYEDLICADPRLAHKVAVSRAVNRVGQHFLQRVIEQMGGTASPSVTPRTLMEPIISVLIELYPKEFERELS
jgi:hypothetical protein